MQLDLLGQDIRYILLMRNTGASLFQSRKTDVIIITSKGQNFNCLCSNVTELLSQQLDSVSQYLPQLLHVHTPRLRCLLIWYELIFNLRNALIKPGLVKENWRGMIMRQGGFLVSKLTISHISLCQHFPALIFD